MSDAEYQAKLHIAREAADVVGQILEKSSPEAKAARAAYRRALEEAANAAPNDSVRATLEAFIKNDPKAQP